MQHQVLSAIKAGVRLAVHMLYTDDALICLFSFSVSSGQKPPKSLNFTASVSPLLPASDWTRLEASSSIELREASGVLCLIELLRGAAAPYVSLSY